MIRHRERCDCVAIRHVSDLWIPANVANEYDFINATCHVVLSFKRSLERLLYMDRNLEPTVGGIQRPLTWTEGRAFVFKFFFRIHNSLHINLMIV